MDKLYVIYTINCQKSSSDISVYANTQKSRFNECQMRQDFKQFFDGFLTLKSCFEKFKNKTTTNLQYERYIFDDIYLQTNIRKLYILCFCINKSTLTDKIKCS